MLDFQAKLAAVVRALRSPGRIAGALSVAMQQCAGLLWAPVWLGLGIAAMFALPWTAQREHFLILLGLLLGATLIARRRAPARLWLAVALVLLGAVRTELRVQEVAAPRLTRQMTATLTGRLLEVQPTAEGRMSLTLKPDSAPGEVGWNKVRLSASSKTELPEAGARVWLRARLMPTASPQLPGGFDRAGRDWFRGIGARGMVIGPVTLIEPAAQRFSFQSSRRWLAARLSDPIGGDAGTVAAAVITGEDAAISAEARAALQTSSLYHLLSVSGFHLAVVTALVFLLVRRGLALIPRLALDWPLKSIAAGVAMLAAILYTLFTGAAWPTVRSCIAVCIVMLAIMMGRRPFSLRLVAAAAFAILLWRPEALVDVSFQFSFAAICGLIVAHDSHWSRQLQARREGDGMVMRLLRHLAYGALISIACELAIAPIALLHFNRLGLYGVVANAVAAPLMSWIIMPLGLLASMLAPFGAEGPVVHLLGRSCQLLLDIAQLVSSWPMARLGVPDPGTIAFCIAMLALGCAILLRRLKLAALPGILACVAATLHPQPDVMIAAAGAPVTLRTASGVLVDSESAGASRREEQLSTTFAAPDHWNWSDGGAGFGITSGAPRCGGEGCAGSIQRGAKTWRIHVLGRNADPLRCPASIDVLIDGRKTRRLHCTAPLAIDRRWLAMRGATTLRFTRNRIILRSDREVRGDRPWVQGPWGNSYAQSMSPPQGKGKRP